MKRSISKACIILLLMLLSCVQVIADNRASSFGIYGPLRVNTIFPPDFSLQSGTYNGTQIISLHTNATPNAIIRYTTNFIDPTMSYGTLYSGPIVISQSTVIKAIVYLQGVSNSQSPVAIRAYTISYNSNTGICGPLKISTIQPPAFSIAGGEYQGAQSLVLSSELGSNARIRYTVDGSDPSMYSGILYNAPIVIDQNTCIKAVTYLNGVSGSASIVASEVYLINHTANSVLSMVIDSTDGSIPITSIKLDKSSGPSIQKQVTNNQVHFRDNDLANQLESNRKITKINLFAENALVGHINFEYTSDDYQSGKRYNLRLFVHEQHLPYTSETIGTWDYYDTNERMVSMLVEPPSISISRNPMVLVHGVGGSFPAFGRDFIKRLNGDPSSTLDDTNDIWEFYYPYDQHIERSAPLMGNAISNIRLHYPTGTGAFKRVNVIAHSMGGLVTRTYIQNCPSPDTGIRKFLMLGTPNHGSHSSFRISDPVYYPVSSIQNELFVHVDIDSPAVPQMYPGSPFLIQLNSESPRPLYPGSSIQNDYLVLAGKKNELRSFLPEYLAGWEHYSPNSNDDIVVSTASASLLEWGIPLALVNYNHLALHGTKIVNVPFVTNLMNPGFLSTFFQDGYNANSYPFGSPVDSFYLSPPLSGNEASLVQIKFDKPLNSTMIKVKKELFKKSLKLTFATVEEIEEDLDNDDRAFTGFKSNRLRKCGDDGANSYYFLEQKTNHVDTLNPILFPFSRFGQTANLASGSYDLKLYNRKGKLFKTIPNGLNINNYTTSAININLTSAECAHTQLDNTNNPNQTRRIRDGAIGFVEKQYYIDPTVNSTIFYIGDEDASPDFANHNACLIDPLQNVIDHTTPASNPNIEYHEDLSSGFAYYYVKNPQQGLWKLRYNDALPDEMSNSLIDSPLNIHLVMPQGPFSAGDILPFSLPLPLDAEYQNPIFNVSLSYTDSTAVVHELGTIPLNIDQTETAFEGNFTAPYPGLYKLMVSFYCLFDANEAQRHTEHSVYVQNILPSQLLYPANQSVNNSINPELAWRSVANAQAYHLVLYKSMQEAPLLSITLPDTLYIAQDLDYGEEYYWQVNALGSFGSSISSDFYSFKTLLPAPVPLYPQDGAEGIPQTIKVTWQALDGAQSYALQLDYEPYFENCLLDVTDISQNSYDLSGLLSLETYYWRVRAINGQEQGAWSNAQAFTIRQTSIEFPPSCTILENTSLTLYLQDYIDDYSPSLYELSVSNYQYLQVSLYPDRISFVPPDQWFGSEDVSLRVYAIGRRNSVKNPAKNEVTPIYECSLMINVLEVNDLPTLSLDEELIFWHNEEASLNLAPYLYDPDNSLDEIIIKISTGTNIDVRLHGRILSFQAPHVWQGSELIEIKLYNPLTQINTLDRNIPVYNSYFLLITFLKATPQISDIKTMDGHIKLTWKAIPAAGEYRIMQADSPTDTYQDVTDSGILTQESDYHSWLAPISRERAFYRVKAIKAVRNTNRGRINDHHQIKSTRGSK